MTAQDLDTEVASGRAALRRFAPEVARLVDRLAGPVADAPMAWARAATSEITGLPVLAGARAAEQTEQGQVVEELAQQMALDISSFSAEQRDRGAAVLGRAARTWYLAAYLADWIPRVRHALDLAFGVSDWDRGVEEASEQDLWPDFVAMTEAVGALRGLDAVTSEVVRLRMARQHNCELCQSLRNRTALDAGGTEDFYSAIDSWRDSDQFDARTRAALAWTDALVWAPRTAETVLADLQRHFTDAEVVEMTVDMLRNAANKVAIASGTDGANVSEGQEIYDITETGETVFGLGHLV